MTTSLADVRWVANLHTMFTEHSLLERPAAARAAGFSEVEYWWPFDGQPRPTRDQIEQFVEAVTSAEVQLTAMNLYAGAMASGDRGVISHPGSAQDFRDSVEVAVAVGARLGTRLFNVPYGRRLADVPAAEQDAAAVEALSYAATSVASFGGTVLVEPLSGFPDYPVRTSRAALEVIDRARAAVGRAGETGIGLLMDQYHLATNGEDVMADLDLVAPYLRHVQVADVPGRGAPGSAEGNVRGFVEKLLGLGYNGAVALEYLPAGNTAESVAIWREAFGTRCSPPAD